MSVTYDEKKFAELVIYIAQHSADDDRFGATKLNKILFFSDFISYQDTGQAITGAVYQKLPHGPAPRQLKPVENTLLAAGDVTIEHRPIGKFIMKPLVAQRDADTSLFTDSELACVDHVLKSLLNHNATSVSEVSHDLSLGWQIVEIGEEIPYQTVYLVDPKDIDDTDVAVAHSFISQWGSDPDFLAA